MFAVTGANGHLGRRLLERLAALESGAGGGAPARALVRSRHAAADLAQRGIRGVDVRVVDYGDRAAMVSELAGVRRVVHLVGIIRESAKNRYADAHEGPAAALAWAAAAAGVERIVGLSILGADTGHSNACLRSRAAADAHLLGGPVPAVVLRVPMVLGVGDHAAKALAGQARAPLAVTLRASSLEQPVDADDVVRAVLSLLEGALPGPGIVELAGPESLSRRALIERAAAVLGRRARVLSVPLPLGLGLAAMLERLMAAPPVTRAMLGVLDHDDCVDAAASAAQLGIRLTPLDETLHRVLGA
jgi:uncharacterized protein YbjT (DUF2867 family)